MKEINVKYTLETPEDEEEFRRDCKPKDMALAIHSILQEIRSINKYDKVATFATLELIIDHALLKYDICIDDLIS